MVFFKSNDCAQICLIFRQLFSFIVERAIREKNAPEPVANWLLTGYNTLDVSFHSVFYFCAAVTGAALAH